MSKPVAASLSILLLAASLGAHAIPSTPPSPPAIPMPAPVDTTGWVMVQNVDEFKDGLMRYCVAFKTNWRNLLVDKCTQYASTTPAGGLAQIGPKGAVLTGFSPYFSSHGSLRGMLLYYKMPETANSAPKP